MNVGIIVTCQKCGATRTPAVPACRKCGNQGAAASVAAKATPTPVPGRPAPTYHELDDRATPVLPVFESCLSENQRQKLKPMNVEDLAPERGDGETYGRGQGGAAHA